MLIAPAGSTSTEEVLLFHEKANVISKNFSIILNLPIYLIIQPVFPRSARCALKQYYIAMHTHTKEINKFIIQNF